MLKDIPEIKVEDLALAIVPDLGEDEVPHEFTVWDVFLINLKKQQIYGVLVTSRGYGMRDGEEVKTSVLRHFFDYIEPSNAVRVEPIDREVFGLNNEYWVSFYIGSTIYDKKYTFLPETITEENFSYIPVIDKQGVMIR
ncbi:MAG: hypothetical protein ACK5C5_04345 [Bacteroidota bacterium]|jgi:hypothetical protein